MGALTFKRKMTKVSIRKISTAMLKNKLQTFAKVSLLVGKYSFVTRRNTTHISVSVAQVGCRRSPCICSPLIKPFSRLRKLIRPFLILMLQVFILVQRTLRKEEESDGLPSHELFLIIFLQH